ncbi:hypothetical protein WME99_43975 [Sorangium sp. So ce136]|uniref:hypothetical protein n=1 Tax=Sorangium sp. So ce136 TaxID=3133284 RepID=UPI003F0EC99F
MDELLIGSIVGFTDWNEVRRKGMTCSGVMPIRSTMADAAGTHGGDERISGSRRAALLSVIREIASVMVDGGARPW